ncbi:MAG: hypothetical protein ACYCYO_00240 [Bacilli bacterium]
MPAGLLTTLFALAVSFMMLVIVTLAPTLLFAKVQLQAVAQNAARMAAITQSTSDVQVEIAQNLQDAHLPVTWQGNTLFVVQNMQTAAGSTGYAVQTGPTTQETTVTIQYDAPLPFDRALTLVGGPVLNLTLPITETGTYFNETQYTGTSVP